MDETEAPSPAPLHLPTTDLIARLDAQIIASLDETVTKLQALQKNRSLETKAFKEGVQKALNSAQASLFLRTVPLLLDIHLPKGCLKTEELIQKVHQTTETLQDLCREQARQTLAAKAATVLEKIQAKEQKIREQVIQKQKTLSQIISNKT